MNEINFSKLICPRCKSDSLSRQDTQIKCKNLDCPHNNLEHWFNIVDNIPILISDKTFDTVFDPNKIGSLVKRANQSSFFYKVKEFILGNSRTTVNNCNKFIKLIKNTNKKPSILVIGSGEKGSGTDELYNDKDISITLTDIYVTENVQYICDAHYLPFKGSAFDGVWIQAVLEHVVDPRVVVAEIHRVMKASGYVYAETPFMQQVHEGAYDFTRYTVLGHRYLFKDFESILIGGNGGSGEVLSWSVKHFVWSLLRSENFARVISFPFMIFFKILEKFSDKKSLYDSSSGVFFLGKKSSKQISHSDLVDLYSGFQK